MSEIARRPAEAANKASWDQGFQHLQELHYGWASPAAASKLAYLDEC
eukprot:CAMPEP_0114228252 /NCGR_PEP_ID=MMETSP0058-20121206/2237_1 /TAXON_ID=36894 /ORGANISM="Pyramimonas parkeae, CCMP726" /LENGTH=46 /DNA_ID= /DNA_START= /DNA_END= /DNA_ORIENTATION=